MNRTRAAWIDVELENIVHNVKAVQTLAQKDAGRPIMAMPVIKGNAYGHGIFEVARILGESGVEWMAVATYSEARLALLAAPQTKVLILGYTPLDMMDEIVRYGIRPCVYTYEQALTLSEQAQAQGKTAYIHIKVDTGMHRLGFNVSEQSADTVAAICDLPNVCVEGLFTHFATSAMREKEYVHYQYRGFIAFKEMLAARGVDIPVKHLSNCGIILDSPEYHQDMIRFGSMVFGSYSSNEVCKARVQLKDAFALRAEVACVKELAPGEGVGYDLAFIAQRPTRIAVLPLGYADMICLRRLKNKGYVLLHGKRAPMVGCVCMDQLMIDVTEIENVAMGDVATLIGRDGDEVLTLQEVADRVGTDGYEVLLSNTQRLPIRYWKGGEMIGALDIHQTLLSYYERIYNL